MALGHPEEKNLETFKTGFVVAGVAIISLSKYHRLHRYTEVIYLQLIWLIRKWQILKVNIILVGYCKLLSFSLFSLSLFQISKSDLICLTKWTGIIQSPLPFETGIFYIL